jgi:hypothetical protein
MDKGDLIKPRTNNLKKTEYLSISYRTDNRDIEILVHIGRVDQLNQERQQDDRLAALKRRPCERITGRLRYYGKGEKQILMIKLDIAL